MDNFLLTGFFCAIIFPGDKIKMKMSKLKKFLSSGRKLVLTRAPKSQSIKEWLLRRGTALALFILVFAAASVVKIQASGNVTGWNWGGSEKTDMGGVTGDNNASCKTYPAPAGCIDGNETGVGWINMAGGNYGGVTIPDSTCTGTGCNLSGYAWSENIGWIQFDPASPYPTTGCGSAGCPTFSSKRTGNNLEGWARITSIYTASILSNPNSGGWVGWIKLKGTTSGGTAYGWTIDPTTGLLGGYAWSDELGWIKPYNAKIAASCPWSTTPTLEPLTGDIDLSDNGCHTIKIHTNETVKSPGHHAKFSLSGSGTLYTDAGCSSGAGNPATFALDSSGTATVYVKTSISSSWSGSITVNFPDATDTACSAISRTVKYTAAAASCPWSTLTITPPAPLQLDSGTTSRALTVNASTTDTGNFASFNVAVNPAKIKISKLSGCSDGGSPTINNVSMNVAGSVASATIYVCASNFTVADSGTISITFSDANCSDASEDVSISAPSSCPAPTCLDSLNVWAGKTPPTTYSVGNTSESGCGLSRCENAGSNTKIIITQIPGTNTCQVTVPPGTRYGKTIARAWTDGGYCDTVINVKAPGWIETNP